MKPHLKLRLSEGVDGPALPHWEDLIRDRSQEVPRLHPAIDAVLDRYRIPVWATHEYRRRGARWSDDEVKAGLNRVYRLVLQADEDVPESMIRDIELLPEVDYVEIGKVASGRLPDPHAQALSRRTGEDARRAIGLDEAHAVSRGDPEVVVAVLDTGVDLDHPELVDALLPGYDFVDILDDAQSFLGDRVGPDAEPDDDVGHGTHVAGVIAGRGAGMPAGVAPRCRILPVRVLAALSSGGAVHGAGLVDNINVGVKWAVDHGADVINMSLGVRHTGGGLPHAEVVEYARRRGVSVVAASGNDGQMARYYPGALPHVITVGAVDVAGEVAAFSTYGNHVDLVAPGVEVFSSMPAGGYGYSTGTSHAAPFVAGGVALLRSRANRRGRRLTDGQCKHVLRHTADKPDRRFQHPRAGFGHLNLADAMRFLEYKLDQRGVS